MGRVASAFICALFLFPKISYAQEKEYVDVCAVSLVDLTSEKSQSASTFNLQQLGSFEPVRGEEERTTKFFEIPGTKLFAVTSVFYTDESMAVEHPGQKPAINDVSASMELLVSKAAQRDVFSSLHYAQAEVMFAEPGASRVSTIFKTSGKTLMLVMECRTDLRSRLDKKPDRNP